MDFMKRMMSTVRAGVTGSGIAPNFPYELDELLLPPAATGGLWAIHAGHAVRSDGPDDKVTIFAAKVSRRPNVLAALKNAVRRLKTIRHPHVLRYIASVEGEGEIFVATERVIPLTAHGMIEEVRKSSEGMLWLVNLLLKALSFLNNEAGIIHGNVRLGSLFLTPSGEAKLGAFELASSPTRDEESLLVDFSRIINNVNVRDWPPEVSSPSGSLPWRQLKSFPPSAIDSFMLGKCLAELFHTTRMPAEITAFINGATETDPRRRPSAAEFLEKAQRLFQNVKLLDIAERMDALAVMEFEQRERYLAHVNQHTTALPESFLKYKVVPSLVAMLQVPAAQGSVAGIRLLMSCAALFGGEELQKAVLPTMSLLLARPDRAVRMTLLESISSSSMVEEFDNRIVQETIYPQIISGFTDGLPALREQTLKTSLLLAPKLSSRQLNGELLRFYARLQGDEQPGIRVNTAVCLGRIAPLLEPSTRQKILVAALVRALRDPFAPARAAALAAVNATMELLSPGEIAQGALPSIVALLIDPDRGVRESAFRITSQLVQRLEVHSATIPSPLPVVDPRQSPTQAAGGGKANSPWGFGIGSLADKLMGTAIGEDIAPSPREKSSAALSSARAQPVADTASHISPVEQRTLSKPKRLGPVRTIQARTVIPPMETKAKPEADGWDADDDLGLEPPNDSLEDGHDVDPVQSPAWQDEDNPWTSQTSSIPIEDPWAQLQPQSKPPYTSATATTGHGAASKPMVLGRKKQQDLLDL